MDRMVKFFLEPKARIPSWLKERKDEIEISSKTIEGRKIRILVIKGGEVQALEDGLVYGVRMEDCSEFHPAFRWQEVLKIEIDDDVVIKSSSLCEACFRNTGLEIKVQFGKEVGSVYATHQCARCGRRWVEKIM